MTEVVLPIQMHGLWWADSCPAESCYLGTHQNTSFSASFSNIITFIATDHSTIQRTIWDSPGKDYLKECSLNVVIFCSGWMCLQEQIVKANSSSNISHCRTGTNMPKKSKMLGKPLICIRLCFVYSSGLGIYRVCAKRCPTALLFETVAVKSEKYLQGKENNIYQHDLKLMAVPELTGSTDATVWFKLSKPSILWFGIHFHLALITSIKQLPRGQTWLCNCAQKSVLQVALKPEAVGHFMHADWAAFCRKNL